MIGCRRISASRKARMAGWRRVMSGCARPMSRRGSPRAHSGSGSPPCAREATMSDAIAIIGDRFMLPSVFANRIAAACGGNGVSIRTLEQPWPDQPMEHGYADAALDRLKEFMGDPDEVVAFIDR